MTEPDALSRALIAQQPALAGNVHYVDGRPWCDGINHTTRCRPGTVPAPAKSGRPAMTEIREFTCGSCGTEFSTNCTDDDIACPECEAQRCPNCEFWFGERP